MSTIRKTFNIGQHYMSAFINSDESGLEKEDVDLINEFISTHGPEVHVYMPEGSPHFTKCDVSGLYDTCYECEVDVTE